MGTATTTAGVNAGQGAMTGYQIGGPWGAAAGAVVGGATGAVSGKYLSAGIDERNDAQRAATAADAADIEHLRSRYATFDHWGVEQQQEALARLRAVNTAYTARLRSGPQAQAMRTGEAARLAAAGAVPQVEGAAGPTTQFAGGAQGVAQAYGDRARARAARALAPTQYDAGNAYLEADTANNQRDFTQGMLAHKTALGLDDPRNQLEAANINAWNLDARGNAAARWDQANRAGQENIGRANMIQGAFQSLNSMGGSIAGGMKK